MKARLRVWKAFSVFGLVGSGVFASLFVTQSAQAFNCMAGVSCTLKNSNCGAWGGITCANAGGQQDTSGCANQLAGWLPDTGACGTVLKWTGPFTCITPSTGTCGTNSLPC